MTEFEFDWYSNDYINLQGKCWIPSQMPKAIICLVHGFGEHIDRYKHLAEYLAAQDLCLVAFNQRGHGSSEGERGHTPNYAQLLEDVRQFLALINDKFRSIPKIIYGHSFGGNVVANYIIKFQPDYLQGAIITSPWLRLAFEPPVFLVTLGKIMNKVYPRFATTSQLNSSEICDDAEISKNYENDTLNHSRISARMYHEITKHGRLAIKTAHKISLPTLLLHGTADKITSVEASKEFAKNIHPDLLTFRLWENAKHELHHQRNRNEIFEQICVWIREIIAKNTPQSN